MTRLDNDLISRKALLEKINNIDAKNWNRQGMTRANQGVRYLNEYSVISAITNAPTIEADRGEAVYELYLEDDFRYKEWVGVDKEIFDISELPNNHKRILYTSPPNREWVELTDEQIYECDEDGEFISLRKAKAIQAKLKEVNHG